MFTTIESQSHVPRSVCDNQLYAVYLPVYRAQDAEDRDAFFDERYETGIDTETISDNGEEPMDGGDIEHLNPQEQMEYLFLGQTPRYRTLAYVQYKPTRKFRRFVKRRSYFRSVAKVIEKVRVAVPEGIVVQASGRHATSLVCCSRF